MPWTNCTPGSKSRVSTLPEEHRLLVTSHDSFQYFAKRYGFEVVGAIFPISTETEPTAQELAELIETIEHAGAPAVFAEKSHSARLGQRVAEQTGATLVGGSVYRVSGRAGRRSRDTYIDLMRYNVDDDRGGPAISMTTISPPPPLAAEDLTVERGGVRVLDQVSFTAGPGCLMGVVGPNGAGKSTLFNVIVSLLPATEGRVLIHGQSVSDARGLVAYVPQYETGQLAPPHDRVGCGHAGSDSQDRVVPASGTGGPGVGGRGTAPGRHVGTA